MKALAGMDSGHLIADEDGTRFRSEQRYDSYPNPVPDLDSLQWVPIGVAVAVPAEIALVDASDHTNAKPPRR